MYVRTASVPGSLYLMTKRFFDVFLPRAEAKFSGVVISISALLNGELEPIPDSALISFSYCVFFFCLSANPYKGTSVVLFAREKTPALVIVQPVCSFVRLFVFCVYQMRQI